MRYCTSFNCFSGPTAQKLRESNHRRRNQRIFKWSVDWWTWRHHLWNCHWTLTLNHVCGHKQSSRSFLDVSGLLTSVLQSLSPFSLRMPQFDMHLCADRGEQAQCANSVSSSVTCLQTSKPRTARNVDFIGEMWLKAAASAWVVAWMNYCWCLYWFPVRYWCSWQMTHTHTHTPIHDF